jgi:hypothetical protein
MIIVKKIITINSNELFESMFTFMIVEFFLIRTYLIWKTKKIISEFYFLTLMRVMKKLTLNFQILTYFHFIISNFVEAFK